MIEISGYTAEAMAKIVNETIASGSVDETGHLILTRKDGTLIDAGSVIGPKGDTVFSGTLADGTVTSAAIQGGAVTREKIADNAIGTTEIIDKNVTLEKLADGVLSAYNIVTPETAITDFPTGWANYGSDGAGSYSPVRVYRLGGKMACLAGQIKCGTAMASTSALSSTTSALPAWAKARENTLMYFGTSQGSIIRVAVNSNNSWGIYANGTAVNAGTFFSFGIMYALV